MISSATGWDSRNADQPNACLHSSSTRQKLFQEPGAHVVDYWCVLSETRGTCKTASGPSDNLPYKSTANHKIKPTFDKSDILFRESVFPFFLAAEFHRFFTAFSDLPGSNFAILVQLQQVHEPGITTSIKGRRVLIMFG